MTKNNEVEFALSGELIQVIKGIKDHYLGDAEIKGIQIGLDSVEFLLKDEARVVTAKYVESLSIDSITEKKVVEVKLDPIAKDQKVASAKNNLKINDPEMKNLQISFIKNAEEGKYSWNKSLKNFLDKGYEIRAQRTNDRVYFFLRSINSKYNDMQHIMTYADLEFLFRNTEVDWTQDLLRGNKISFDADLVAGYEVADKSIPEDTPAKLWVKSLIADRGYKIIKLGEKSIKLIDRFHKADEKFLTLTLDEAKSLTGLSSNEVASVLLTKGMINIKKDDSPKA